MLNRSRHPTDIDDKPLNSLPEPVSPLARAHELLRHCVQAHLDMHALRVSRSHPAKPERKPVSIPAGLAMTHYLHHINPWQPLTSSAIDTLACELKHLLDRIDLAVRRADWLYAGRLGQATPVTRQLLALQTIWSVLQTLPRAESHALITLMAAIDPHDGSIPGHGLLQLDTHSPMTLELLRRMAFTLQSTSPKQPDRSPGPDALPATHPSGLGGISARYSRHQAPLPPIDEAEIEVELTPETPSADGLSAMTGCDTTEAPPVDVQYPKDWPEPLLRYISNAPALLAEIQTTEGELSYRARQRRKARLSAFCKPRIEALLEYITDQQALKDLGKHISEATSQLDRSPGIVSSDAAHEKAIRQMLATASSLIQERILATQQTPLHRMPELQAICQYWPDRLRNLLEQAGSSPQTADFVLVWKQAPAIQQALVVYTVLADRKIRRNIKDLMAQALKHEDGAVRATAQALQCFFEFLQQQRLGMSEEAWAIYSASANASLAARQARTGQSGNSPSTDGHPNPSSSSRQPVDTVVALDHEIDEFLTGLGRHVTPAKRNGRPDRHTSVVATGQSVFCRLAEMGTHEISSLLDSIEQRFIEMDPRARRPDETAFKARTVQDEQHLQQVLQWVDQFAQTTYDRLPMLDVLSHLNSLRQQYLSSENEPVISPLMDNGMAQAQLLVLCADEFALKLADNDCKNIDAHIRETPQLSESAQKVLRNSGHLTLWYNGRLNVVRFDEMFSCLPVIGESLKTLFYRSLARVWAECPHDHVNGKREAITRQLETTQTPPNNQAIDALVTERIKDLKPFIGPLERRLGAMVNLTGSRHQGLIRIGDRQLKLGRLKRSPANALAFLIADMTLEAIRRQRP